MKNLAKNHPILSKLIISRILPVFLLATISLSSLSINGMAGISKAYDKVSVSIERNPRASLAIGIAAACWASYKCLQQHQASLLLIYAAKSNNLAQVNEALANGADVNAKDSYGKTALMRATEGNHTEICKLLIAAGADVNAKNNYGYTALIYAVMNGNAEICTQLIAAGADINAKRYDGYTALIYAAQNGLTEICTQLIAAGADVNAKRYDGYTALSLAAMNGNAEICAQLIAADADVNAKNNYGYTALMRAAAKRLTEICTQLIIAGTEIPEDLRDDETILAVPENLRNTPPLIRALTSPYPRQAGHLITLANINELLRTHDINSYIGNPAEKTTLLMLVAERGTSPETPRIIAELVRRGAKINAQDRYGRTALHRVFTVSNKQYKFVDITDASGEIVGRQTVACGLDRSAAVTAQVIKQLLDSGIDVFIKDYGLEEDWNPTQEPGLERTAFYYAGIIPLEITKLLTNAGAHYDSKEEWQHAKPRAAKAAMIAKLSDCSAWTSED